MLTLTEKLTAILKGSSDEGKDDQIDSTGLDTPKNAFEKADLIKEQNAYGFKQVRIAKEGRGITYGKVTKYLAIDCEMDLNTEGMTREELEKVVNENYKGSKNPGYVLKVSIVNSKGETVLDTLVDYTTERVAKVIQNAPKSENEEPQPSQTDAEQEGKRSERLKLKRMRKEKSVHFDFSQDTTRVIEPKDSSSCILNDAKVGTKRSNSQRSQVNSQEKSDTELKQDKDIEVLLNKLSFKKRKLNIESHNLARIHGISQHLLSGSPTLTQVKNHIKEMLTEFEKQNKEAVVFVGHSVLNDIEAMRMDKVPYIDTTNFKFKSDQHGQIRKLKELVQEHLGYGIQEDCHTSLQDAKATMDLFLKFKDHPEGFYSDKTIQIHIQSEQQLKKDQKIKQKLKRRVKLHSKEIQTKLKKIEAKREMQEESNLNLAQSISQTIIQSSSSTMKMLALGVSLYAAHKFSPLNQSSVMQGISKLSSSIRFV